MLALETPVAVSVVVRGFVPVLDGYRPPTTATTQANQLGKGDTDSWHKRPMKVETTPLERSQEM